MLIMIIEDEPVAAAMLQMLLEQQGHETIAASSGEEAVEIAKLSAPDLVISDFNLGSGMSGAEACKVICEMKPDTPLVLVTGLPVKDIMPRVSGIAPLAYLEKPLDIDEIFSVIAALEEAKKSE